MFTLMAVSPPANANANSDMVLQRIQETQVFRIGYNPANKPFSFPADNGAAQGYSIDLCAHVARKLADTLGLGEKMKIEYKQIKSSDRIPLLQKGDIDIECGASTNTLERQQFVGFSVTFFVASGRILVNKSSGISDYRDLDPQKRVVVVKGTTGQQSLKARLNSLGRKPQIIELMTEAEAEKYLNEGKADGYVTDDVLLYAARARLNDPSKWEVVGGNLTVEPYGLMLPKGASGYETIVDRALRDLYLSGEVKEIYAKWFLTKEFDMPMSHFTKESFRWPNKTGADKAF